MALPSFQTLVISIVALLFTSSEALDNGVGKTPAMGYVLLHSSPHMISLGHANPSIAHASHMQQAGASGIGDRYQHVL